MAPPEPRAAAAAALRGRNVSQTMLPLALRCLTRISCTIFGAGVTGGLPMSAVQAFCRKLLPTKSKARLREDSETDPQGSASSSLRFLPLRS